MNKENFRVFGKTKKCKVCQKDRLRANFYYCSSSRDDLRSTCISYLKAKRDGVKIIPEPLTVSERVKLYFEQKQ